MKFWDSSAVVPLLVEEESSARLLDLYAGEEAVLVWWSTSVECTSALARLERSSHLSPGETRAALGRLDSLEETWDVVEPTPRLARSAKRLLRTHELRAADSLQLAAALLAAEGEPASLPFVCLDERLCVAADREGLDVFGRERL
ncbi:MAG: type II toxin-antitoxin system VapC family toxin [Thermoanaerobaculia bacterium]